MQVLGQQFISLNSTRQLLVKIATIIFSLITLFNVKAFAQPNPQIYDVKKDLPTSPEAAMIRRFGDVPIGYYTGTANISIPLYNVRCGGLTLPITLQYHSAGIKVDDQAGWTGLGWNLQPEGTIIQIVRGKEDELDDLTVTDGFSYLKSRSVPGGIPPGVGGIAVPGDYGFTPDIGFNGWACTFVPYDNLSCGIVQNGSGDKNATLLGLTQGEGEPDIYQFNFMNYSGKFYINPETHAIVQLDKKDQLTFVKTGLGNTSYWTAIALDGTKFTFNALELTGGTPPNNADGYTWKLTSIETPEKKTVTFTYADGTYSWTNFSQIMHEAYPYGFEPGSESGINYTNTVTHNTKTLTRITTADVIIDFNLEAREDIDGVNVKRLKSIDIKSAVTNALVKSYNFDYSYFAYSTVGGHYGTDPLVTPVTGIDFYGKRLRLDYLREVGYTSTGTPITIPPYKFDYNNSVLLPLKTSFAVDYWGYYNGQNNNRLIPDFNYFYYSGNMPAIGILNKLGYTGANRVPDNSKVTAAILTKVTYPTGGYSEFDYEPNTFTNFSYPDQARINASSKSITVKDANSTPDIKSVQFSIKKNQVIRVSCQIFNGYPIQTPAPFSYNDMLGSSITLVKANLPGGVGTTPVFTTIRTWDLTTTSTADFNTNHGRSWYEEIPMSVDPDPLCYYVISANLPDALGPQNSATKIAYVTSQLGYFDETGLNMSVSTQNGVRVSAVRNYTDPGTIASNKVIRYINEDGTSSGVLLAPLKYIFKKSLWFTKSDYPDCAMFQTMQQDRNFIYSNSANGNGNNVAYSRVEESEIAPDNSNNGKHVYYYLNYETKTQQNLPDIPFLKNGFLKKEEIFNSDGNRLVEKNYTYLNLLPTSPSVSSYNCYKIFSNFIGVDPCVEYNIHGTPNHKYGIYFYPLNSEWNVPGTVETKQFDLKGQTKTDLETYAYNTFGQRISTSALNSKLQNISSTTLFSSDDVSPTSTQLRALNLYNQPIEIKSIVNGSEVSKLLYTYGQKYTTPNTIMFPSIVKRSLNQQTPTTEVTFEDYGPNVNMLRFTQNGIPSQLIWDDVNSNVIAQVTPASDDKAAYTSFEPGATGNWTFLPAGVTTITTAAPVTGQKVYQLSNGLSRAGLSAAQPYTISYWSRSGAFAVSGGATATAGPTLNGWTLYEHLISGVTSVSISGTGFIDEVRLYNSGGSMTNYTYQPLLGISTQTDANNRIFYYEYDAFGRLILVRDQDKNIVKKLCYNYSGDVVDCSVPVTTPVSCAAGYQMVTYTNTSNIGGYMAVYTSTTAPYTVYSFPIPNGNGNLGCLPNGVYNISVFKPGGGGMAPLIIKCGGTTVSGTSADVKNVTITNGSTKLAKSVSLAYDL